MEGLEKLGASGRTAKRRVDFRDMLGRVRTVRQQRDVKAPVALV
jgi:hypothetical protein